jgi:hypothetical protein
MAYFYVKNSLGTRTTGGGLTKQTGSFTTLGASNVYATIAAAITDGAGAGDFICVSDAHTYTHSTHLTDYGSASGVYLYIVSVDDSNCDAYAKAAAAQEGTSGANDIYLGGRSSIHGMYYDSGDNIYVSGGSFPSLVANNCTFELNTGFFTSATVDGTSFELHNCEIKGLSTSYFRPTLGGHMRMYGGSVTGFVNQLTSGGFYNGGAKAEFVGVDLSSISGTLISGAGGDEADDLIEIIISGCKLHSSVTLVGETPSRPSHHIRITNSAATSAEAEYQFHAETLGGAVDEETSIYRDASTPFPVYGLPTSLKCATNADATKATPFWFDFPTRYAELSSATSDQITVYLYTDTQLYDSDVWIEAVYPDDTNKHLYNFQSTRHTDIMDTNGTELTTNTEAWTGTAMTYKYQVDRNSHDVQVSGDDGHRSRGQ